MLDTNLLVDFILIQWLEENKKEIHSKYKHTKILRDFWLNKKFDNLICCFGVWELSDCIKNKIFDTRLLREGYNRADIDQIKREDGFNSSDINITRDIVNTISNNSVYLEINEVNKKVIDAIDSFVKLGIDMNDAILLYHASTMPECKYFVTKDGLLKKSIDYIIPKYYAGLRSEEDDLKVINIKEFIDIVQREDKK